MPSLRVCRTARVSLKGKYSRCGLFTAWLLSEKKKKRAGLSLLLVPGCSWIRVRRPRFGARLSFGLLSSPSASTFLRLKQPARCSAAERYRNHGGATHGMCCLVGTCRGEETSENLQCKIPGDFFGIHFDTLSSSRNLVLCGVGAWWVSQELGPCSQKASGGPWGSPWCREGNTPLYPC